MTDPIEEPDINICPGCGGYADNGFDRGLPPSPYYCTKCTEAEELRAKLAIAEDKLTEARAECERLRERANNEEARQTCPRCGYGESHCQCVPEEW